MTVLRLSKLWWWSEVLGFWVQVPRIRSLRNFYHTCDAWLHFAVLHASFPLMTHLKSIALIYVLLSLLSLVEEATWVYIGIFVDGLDWSIYSICLSIEIHVSSSTFGEVISELEHRFVVWWSLFVIVMHEEMVPIIHFTIIILGVFELILCLS
jgi:hypothetical protein